MWRKGRRCLARGASRSLAFQVSLWATCPTLRWLEACHAAPCRQPCLLTLTRPFILPARCQFRHLEAITATTCTNLKLSASLSSTPCPGALVKALALVLLGGLVVR